MVRYRRLVFSAVSLVLAAAPLAANDYRISFLADHSDSRMVVFTTPLFGKATAQALRPGDYFPVAPRHNYLIITMDRHGRAPRPGAFRLRLTNSSGEVFTHFVLGPSEDGQLRPQVLEGDPNRKLHWDAFNQWRERESVGLEWKLSVVSPSPSAPSRAVQGTGAGGFPGPSGLGGSPLPWSGPSLPPSLGLTFHKAPSGYSSSTGGSPLIPFSSASSSASFSGQAFTDPVPPGSVPSGRVNQIAAGQLPPWPGLPAPARKRKASTDGGELSAYRLGSSPTPALGHSGEGRASSGSGKAVSGPDTGSARMPPPPSRPAKSMPMLACGEHKALLCALRIPSRGSGHPFTLNAATAGGEMLFMGQPATEACLLQPNARHQLMVPPATSALGEVHRSPLEILSGDRLDQTIVRSEVIWSHAGVVVAQNSAWSEFLATCLSRKTGLRLTTRLLPDPGSFPPEPSSGAPGHGSDAIARSGDSSGEPKPLPYALRVTPDDPRQAFVLYVSNTATGKFEVFAQPGPQTLHLHTGISYELLVPRATMLAETEEHCHQGRLEVLTGTGERLDQVSTSAAIFWDSGGVGTRGDEKWSTFLRECRALGVKFYLSFRLLPPPAAPLKGGTSSAVASSDGSGSESLG